MITYAHCKKCLGFVAGHAQPDEHFLKWCREEDLELTYHDHATPPIGKVCDCVLSAEEDERSKEF